MPPGLRIVRRERRAAGRELDHVEVVEVERERRDQQRRGRDQQQREDHGPEGLERSRPVDRGRLRHVMRDRLQGAQADAGTCTDSRARTGSCRIANRAVHTSPYQFTLRPVSELIRPKSALNMSRQAGTDSSGRDELVVVAMDPVAQAEARRIGRDGDRAHDLADLPALAEEEVPAGHPAPDAGRVAVELERARVDQSGARSRPPAPRRRPCRGG